MPPWWVVGALAGNLALNLALLGLIAQHLHDIGREVQKARITIEITASRVSQLSASRMFEAEK